MIHLFFLLEKDVERMYQMPLGDSLFPQSQLGAALQRKRRKGGVQVSPGKGERRTTLQTFSAHWLNLETGPNSSSLNWRLQPLPP